MILLMHSIVISLTIDDSLASELPNSDIDAISYINPTNSSFSFTEINVEIVIEILKSVNPNKAIGPDNILGRVLSSDNCLLRSCPHL